VRVRARTGRSAERASTGLIAAAGVVLLAITGCRATVSGTNGTWSINGNNISVNGSFPGKNSANDAVQQKFDAAEITGIKTETDAGSIEVVGSPSADNVVHIVATRTVRGNEAPEELKKLLAKISPEAVLNGHTLAITAKIPKELRQNSHMASVDYQIKVPERMLFDLRSDAGKVKVSGLRRGGSAHTDAGDIEADHLAGDVNLTASSGKVVIKSSPDVTALTLKTDDGGITIGGVAGRVTADTANGEISVEACPKLTQLTMHSDNGAINVTGCSGSIELGTENGAVVVTNCTASSMLKITSSNGAVQARGIKASGNSLTVQASSNTGAVTYEGDASSVTAKSDSGAVAAQITPTLKLTEATISTENGEANLTVPDSVNATVKVHSENGRAEVPGGMAATESSGDSTTVQMGSGAGKLDVHSSNGNAVLHVSHP
jgi:Putative adhesin